MRYLINENAPNHIVIRGGITMFKKIKAFYWKITGKTKRQSNLMSGDF